MLSTEKTVYGTSTQNAYAFCSHDYTMPPKHHPIFSHSQKLDIFFLSVKKTYCYIRKWTMLSIPVVMNTAKKMLRGNKLIKYVETDIFCR